MKEKEDKCCGNCCWFCFEQTDGDGQCPDGDGAWRFTYCGDTPCNDYVSRQEMRHHMAVLLQASRFYAQGAKKRYIVGVNEFKKALSFAYKYMKVFSDL